MAIDISVLGDKELQKRLSRISDKMQKKIVRTAIRNSAKRAKDRIVANIQKQGLIDTGGMLKAFRSAPIRQSSRNPRKLVRIGVAFPDRADLGIDPDEKVYYPTAVEFGHGGVPAYPFIRPAIDENKEQEHAQIAADIRTGLASA